MQLDVDDEDEPFFKPQVIQTEPLAPRQKDNTLGSADSTPNQPRDSEGSDESAEGTRNIASAVDSE